MGARTKSLHIILDLWGCDLGEDELLHNIMQDMSKSLKENGYNELYENSNSLSKYTMQINHPLEYGYLSLTMHFDSGYVAMSVLNHEEIDMMPVVRDFIDILKPMGVSVKSLQRGHSYGIQEEYSFIKEREYDELIEEFEE